MSDFKVGDIVEAIQDVCGLIIGKKYIVQKVYPSDDTIVVKGKNICIFTKRFKLATSCDNKRKIIRSTYATKNKR